MALGGAWESGSTEGGREVSKFDEKGLGAGKTMTDSNRGAGDFGGTEGRDASLFSEKGWGSGKMIASIARGHGISMAVRMEGCLTVRREEVVG